MSYSQTQNQLHPNKNNSQDQKKIYTKTKKKVKPKRHSFKQTFSGTNCKHALKFLIESYFLL